MAPCAAVGFDASRRAGVGGEVVAVDGVVVSLPQVYWWRGLVVRMRAERVIRCGSWLVRCGSANA